MLIKSPGEPAFAFFSALNQGPPCLELSCKICSAETIALDLAVARASDIQVSEVLRQNGCILLRGRVGCT